MKTCSTNCLQSWGSPLYWTPRNHLRYTSPPTTVCPILTNTGDLLHQLSAELGLPSLLYSTQETSQVYQSNYHCMSHNDQYFYLSIVVQDGELGLQLGGGLLEDDLMQDLSSFQQSIFPGSHFLSMSLSTSLFLFLSLFIYFIHLLFLGIHFSRQKSHNLRLA